VVSIFTFTCANPVDYRIDYPLAFSISGTTNQVPGVHLIALVENSGTSPNGLTPKSSKFSFQKVAPQFYLRNFVATAPNAPLAPVTEFANGAAIRFAWESNGSYYQLFAKNNPNALYAGSATTCALGAGAATETTFLLVATMSAGITDPGFHGVDLTLYDAL